MVHCFRRIFCKYVKYVSCTVLVAFFFQIVIAVWFFPTDKEGFIKRNLYKSQSIEKTGDLSARKMTPYIDDEDVSYAEKQNKPSEILRLKELDFKPICDIESREAISAVHRAKTQHCKQKIVNISCLIQAGNFYPKILPNDCKNSTASFGKHLGCYTDDKKLRILSSFYGNYANSNTASACLDVCIQGGFPYAGVQYGTECFCGENKPPDSALTAENACDMRCPGDLSQTCGGYFTMNVYQTGLSKFTPQVPRSGNDKKNVRIIFLLTLNGRALRQVYRLLNAIYRNTHYFYIHIDSRQDYLHRKLSELEKLLPNIKLATNRYSTIWGGASLLQMLLSAMKDFFRLKWEWDYVINLSETDFPIKSLEKLEEFLSENKGLNFVKSHGREVQRFIKKQGLDKTFIECDTHMWRVGERRLPKGIVIDGGSDWIALHSDFVSYLVKQDKLLAGLDVIFQHTLLPAESYFHTVLRNSRFCNTYVDNNLHVTNWKRKLGCKCQYKHVVDWCGCSPNDFKMEDWPRILNTQDRQLFFARKFEPIINQEIITRVEKFIDIQDHFLINNLEAYWQSIFDSEDLTASTDDIMLSHAGSIARHNAKSLSEENCQMEPIEILEISSYNYADVYKGNLILHKALLNKDLEVVIETWYKSKNNLELNLNHPFATSVEIFKVGSDYDQKEQTFRNLGNILGPLSDPILLYKFSPTSKATNLTVMWLDPVGEIADVENVQLNENNLTNFIKPNIKVPHLPGVWKVGLFKQTQLIASTKFLITPLEFFSGKEITYREASIINGGSQNARKHFPNVKPIQFAPSEEESLLLRKISNSNTKRIGEDLREWIDSLTIEFYSILGSCISPKNNYNRTMCGNHKFQDCTLTVWSSLTPDPKGSIGKLNNMTGRLDRI